MWLIRWKSGILAGSHRFTSDDIEVMQALKKEDEVYEFEVTPVKEMSVTYKEKGDG